MNNFLARQNRNPPIAQPVQAEVVETRSLVAHVLLAPGAPHIAAAPDLQPGLIAVLGQHRSGTHILARYCKDFFDGSVQPNPDGSLREQGVVNLGNFHLWKHVVPKERIQIPTSADVPVTVLLTVRDLLPWMQALARGAYEIQRVPRKRRRQGDLEWMLNEVEIDTSPDYHHDLFPNLRFKSLPALWTAYMQGYLCGDICLATSPQRVVIVRHEDIVRRPAEVIIELERLGLRRNSRPFEIIERSVTTQNENRVDIMTQDQAAQRHPTANAILNMLPERGQFLRRSLGYN